LEGRTTPDDQAQRNLEVVKLRITFLQHMTTLSGAATLIILAIMQRARDPFVVSNLATVTVHSYAFTAFFSVVAMVLLINALERTDLPLRRDTGRFTTQVASASFGVGMVFVVIISTRVYVVSFIITAVVMAAILVALFFLIGERSDKPGEDGEDQDATPRP
jgi:hypothetical protein